MTLKSEDDSANEEFASSVAAGDTLFGLSKNLLSSEPVSQRVISRERELSSSGFAATLLWALLLKA